jgi:hypothetical protein
MLYLRLLAACKLKHEAILHFHKFHRGSGLSGRPRRSARLRHIGAPKKVIPLTSSFKFSRKLLLVLSCLVFASARGERAKDRWRNQEMKVRGG